MSTTGSSPQPRTGHPTGPGMAAASVGGYFAAESVSTATELAAKLVT